MSPKIYMSSKVLEYKSNISADISQPPIYLHRTLSFQFKCRRNKIICIFLICLKERLDNTRVALTDAKKQNHNLIERVQGMQNELADSEVRRSELEGQIRQTNTVSRKCRSQDVIYSLCLYQQDKLSTVLFWNIVTGTETRS